MAEKIDKTFMDKCYSCRWRGPVHYSCHSSCANKNAKAEGQDQGIEGGWFHWPYNFDPLWLKSCDSYMKKEEKNG